MLSYFGFVDLSCEVENNQFWCLKFEDFRFIFTMDKSLSINYVVTNEFDTFLRVG